MTKHVSHLLLFAFLLFFQTGLAKPKLYVAVLQTRSYTVGAPNPPSGLFRWEGDTTWTHLGWRGPRNNGVCPDPKDPQIIFLACGNGVFRSMDGGQNWRITTDHRVTEVQDVAVHPLSPNLVCGATAYGICRTTDQGETWLPADLQPKPTFVQTIEADYSVKNRFLTGGEGGIYESTDTGATWKHIAIADTAVLDLHQCRSNPQLWLAGTEGKGVFLSGDGGRSWRRAPGPPSKEDIYATAINPANPQWMAAAGYGTGVFLSTDGGRSWRQIKKGLPSLTIHALSFDPEVAGRLWVGTVGSGVLRTDDLGKNWQRLGLPGAEVWDLTFSEE